MTYSNVAAINPSFDIENQIYLLSSGSIQQFILLDMDLEVLQTTARFWAACLTTHRKKMNFGL